MVQLSHVAIAFVMMLVVGGGAFFGGLKWKESGSVETAAAVSALDSEEELLEADEEIPAPTDVPLYAVVRIVDGDTVVVNVDGKNESVRMIGIETPELNDSRTGVQCFAKEASDRTKTLLTGKKVQLEKDPSQGDRDKYKRLLAHVFREDGVSINKTLISEGYAHEYTYDGEYKYQAQYKAAQKAAEAGEKGLWAPDACASFEAAKKEEPKATAKTNQAAAAAAAAQPLQVAQPTPEPKPEPKPVVKEEAKKQPEPESEEEEEPEPQDPGSIVCSTNTYNCSDFTTKKEAQEVYDQCGGVGHDVHQLDRNKDGTACDSLP
jgi:endonuclease YncB( thermonuclease family)